MPAHEVFLTQRLDEPQIHCAQCNDGHPFVELYRGVARSGMLQAIAMHNASIHKISRFPKTSSRAFATSLLTSRIYVYTLGL